MTIRDIRELLRDWKALTGLIMLISAVVGSSGYAAVQHFAEDEIAIVKEVETWDTPTPVTTDTPLPTEVPSTSLVSPSTPQATEPPTLPANTMTATPKATQTPLPLSPTALPILVTTDTPQATSTSTMKPTSTSTKAETSPTSIPSSPMLILSTPTASSSSTPLPTMTPISSATPTTIEPTATNTPIVPTPAVQAESTTVILAPTPTETPSPTPLPLTWNDIEWLDRAPAPVPDGNPDWVYDSMNGTIYGQVSHPDLLLDITVLQVNRQDCNAILYVVGDTGRQTTTRLYGPSLAAWVDKYGDDAETPYLSILDRLTVAEYDAIAAQIGLVPYAETYGTNDTNPVQQREAEACAASAN